MGLDVYMDKRLGKDNYEDVCYWRRRPSIVDYVNQIRGEAIENNEYEPLNKEQVLTLQELVLENWKFNKDLEDKHLYEYDMKQISEALLFLEKEEVIYFMASW